MATIHSTAVKIPCCLCGTLIVANAANKCGACLASQHDLAAMVQRGPNGSHEIVVHQCRQCRRFQRTERVYQDMEPESPELLALCLKHIPALQGNHDPILHVVDAGWIWTEPHSMRFRVHLTLRYDIDNVPVQQRVKVELRNAWKQCPDCNREYTNRTWQAVVQLRQQRDNGTNKKGMAALEMAIAKNATIRRHVLKIDATKNGFDFYFLSLAHAQAFGSYLQRVAPMRLKTSQKLVSTDVKSNTANIKHTVACDLVPLCRDDLVLVKKSAKARLAGRLALVRKVASTVTLLDASPKRDETALQMELGAENYYRNEKSFRVLQSSDRLVRFVVLDVELCGDEQQYDNHPLYQGPQSGVEQYSLADVLVAREADFGVNDQTFSVVTHLGHLIQVGDVVLGYDMESTVGGDWELDSRNLQGHFVMPDVVLVKKVTDSKGKKSDNAMDDDATEPQPSASSEDSRKKRVSKKKERRRARNEGKKMRELEESALRMGFLDDDGTNNNGNTQQQQDFEDALRNDPELKAELEHMEMALEAIAVDEEKEEPAQSGDEPKDETDKSTKNTSS